jgi:hypothetical protein
MLMCIMLSVVSVVHQIILIVTYSWQYFVGVLELGGILVFMSNYSNNLRHVVGFFIFYHFDKNFKIAFKSLLNKVKEKFL